MTDYYVELKLKRTLGLQEIQKELTAQEKMWHEREITIPEKARRMLTLIDEARKVFSTDSSRRAYDKELESQDAPKELSDPEEERKHNLKKWENEARSYYNDNHYDLAKTAIEKAFMYLDTRENNDDVYALAADIYFETGDLRLALDYINKAIVDAPDIASYYVSKSKIYQKQNADDEMRESLYIAIHKADESGDNISKAHALGALAVSLYFRAPFDKSRAEHLATLAVKLGDSWGNGERVLDDINFYKKKQRAEEVKEKNRKREEEERVLQSIQAALKTKGSPTFFQNKIQALNTCSWMYVSLDPGLRYKLEEKYREAVRNKEEVERLESELKLLEKKWGEDLGVWTSPLFLPLLAVLVLGFLFFLICYLLPGAACFALVVWIVAGVITGLFHESIGELIVDSMYKGKHDALKRQISEKNYSSIDRDMGRNYD